MRVSDGIVKGNTDPRTHFYIARCTCGAMICCPQAPIKAELWAMKHARRNSGHMAYVVNVNLLTVDHRYRFDAIPDNEDGNEPPF